MTVLRPAAIPPSTAPSTDEPSREPTAPVVDDVRRDVGADLPSPGGAGRDEAAGAAAGPPVTLEQRLRVAAGIVAPTTAITALLYYFGYVSTRARFGWFGVDLATLRLSTQEVVLHSAAVLFVPVGALLLLGVLGSWLHAAARRRLDRAAGHPVLRRVAVVTVAAGALLLVRGVVGIVRPGIAETEFPGTTPLCLGAGALAVGYGRYLMVGSAPGQPRRTGADRRLEDTAWVLVWGLVVLSLFWLANTFAAAYGRGQAVADAQDLRSRPAVVLDTSERLYIDHPGVGETSLPATPEQRLRYRYRGLRLLIAAGGRLFLVPEQWQDGSGVVVVPDNDDVRVQYLS